MTRCIILAGRARPEVGADGHDSTIIDSFVLHAFSYLPLFTKLDFVLPYRIVVHFLSTRNDLSC